MILKRSFQDFSVGEQVVFSRTFTEIDVAQCKSICTRVESDVQRGWVRFDAVGTNQEGRQVLRGMARGYPARYRDQAQGK
jgi:acyl dehydratase